MKIINPQIDRKKFVEILQNEFKDMQINDDGLHILQSKKDIGLLSWGKSLTVIFTEKYIYINLTTLGRFDVKSPIHSFTNYLKVKSIGKKLNGI